MEASDHRKWGRGVTRNNGAKNAHARWTDAHVLVFRRRRAAGATWAQLAREYGGSAWGIYWAATRGWKHVPAASTEASDADAA
jgi:hypothetical protein